MRVVDAVWEKRNLGVDAASFHISSEDTLEDVIGTIRDNHSSYQTVILDPARTDMLLELQNFGFKFIECSFILSASEEDIEIPKPLKRFQSQMTYRLATDDEIEQIKSIIRSGDIFKTDKISLDPHFGVKMAGTRYSYWIDDLLNSGKNLYVMTLKDEVIAFEIASISEGTVE